MHLKIKILQYEKTNLMSHSYPIGNSNRKLRKLYLFSDKSLQYLPASVHSSQPLGKVCLVAALPLHILAADLQHRLVHKVHSQLFTGQIYTETLRNTHKI